MVKVGHIKEEIPAGTFRDYLYIQGIETHIEPGSNDMWELWVLEEDHLEKARLLLENFLKDPEASEYTEAAKTAAEKKIQEKKEDEAFRKKIYDRGRLFANNRFRITSVAGILIVISVLITMLSDFGDIRSFIDPLRISEHTVRSEYVTLPEIRSGQIWRLITPIFLHFSWLHIIFNMWWLKDLGHVIAKKHGALFLLIMVLVLGISSNLGQLFVKGPGFGGMSGVVYGLLGYIWIRSKVDPFSGFFISRHVVIMMIAWFFLCLTGKVGNIANMAHAVGLGGGMLWGYCAGQLGRKKPEKMS
ncbi:rhomboid family intramembrane serine protease [Verrucomicrobiota bacterium]